MFMHFSSVTKHRLVKTITLCIIVVMCISLLFFLVLSRFLLIKTPYDYPDTIWVSDDPQIILHVSSKGYDYLTEAFILKDNNKLPIVFLADPKRITAEIYAAQDYSSNNLSLEKALLIVECKYKKDKVVMSIVKDRIFDGCYSTITLLRIRNE